MYVYLRVISPSLLFLLYHRRIDNLLSRVTPQQVYIRMLPRGMDRSIVILVHLRDTLAFLLLLLIVLLSSSRRRSENSSRNRNNKKALSTPPLDHIDRRTQTHIFLSLSLSLYMYGHIYICRERYVSRSLPSQPSRCA